MSKRILILVNLDVVIYNFRKELVEKLLDEGYEVYISSPYGERIEHLKEMGCVYKEAELLNRRGTNVKEEIKLIKYYKKLLKQVDPDIVLTFTIKPNIYGGLACKALGIPYVANITGLGTAVENGGIMQKITTSLYRRALKNVQTVFFQNEENRKFFEDRKIALDRHKLLPGSGVNLDQFQYLEYPDYDTTEFVLISRIMKQKGIEQYLEAAKMIKSKYPDTVFHVCGFIEEEGYEEILKDLHNKGIIQYHGMLNDIRDILRQTHCTVHPTYYPEGMSNVLLESAASGRPLIATDRSGCREVIDASNGYLVKPMDEKSLMNKIENFLSVSYEKKRAMGKNARKKIERDFDRNHIVNEYLKEIEICKFNKGK